ncbi:MAG: rhodanese-like domain-containing protein [Fulvivirga sp.]
MYQNLTPEEWQAQVSKDSNALIIDVRTVGEFQQSHLPSAVHMPDI